MIKVKELSRHYGDFKAVDNVTFEVHKGEVVGLLGHNGAGKTTIMKMITAYLEPTSGSVLIDGKELGGNDYSIRKRIGYLPENCPLWPDMTIIDYLEYQADLHGIPPDRQRAAVARAIGRTALKEKAAHVIGTLSRGYRQRVGVAQAIIHDPDIIILDEPTNGLDPTQISQMRYLIRELAEYATVIISTHILQEVQAVCNRVLIMRGGRMVVDSRLEDLQSGQHLLVSLNNNAAQKYLGNLAGVRAVTECSADSEGNFIFLLDADPEVAPLIVDAVHDAGDKLFALQPERRTLEKVFSEVNMVSEDMVMEVGHA